MSSFRPSASENRGDYRLLRFGAGFSGSPTLRAQEIESVQRSAEATIARKDSEGVRSLRWSRHLDLVAFLLSCLLS